MCYRRGRRAIGRRRTAEPAQPRPRRAGGGARAASAWRRPSPRGFSPACTATARSGFRPDRCAGYRTPPRRRWTRPATGPTLEIIERRRADDGFVKYLFRTADGHEIEAVRIPLPDPADARALQGSGAGPARRRRWRRCRRRSTPLCLSSQVGCALACDFCATGRLGGIRSLKTWEILAQHRLIAAEADHPMRGVVFMGMGEPLLNYENVIRAARILSRPGGPGHRGQGDLDLDRRRAAGHPPLHGRGAPLPADPVAGRADVGGAAPADADRGSLAAGRRDGGHARSRGGARRSASTLAYVVIGGVNTLARARARAGRADRRTARQAEPHRRHRRDRPVPARHAPRSWRPSATRWRRWASRSCAATRAAPTSAPPAAPWPPRDAAARKIELRPLAVAVASRSRSSATAGGAWPVSQTSWRPPISLPVSARDDRVGVGGGDVQVRVRVHDVDRPRRDVAGVGRSRSRISRSEAPSLRPRFR